MEVRLRYGRDLNSADIASYLWQRTQLSLLIILLLLQIYVIVLRRVSIKIVQSDMASLADWLSQLILALHHALPTIPTDSLCRLGCLLFLGPS